MGETFQRLKVGSDNQRHGYLEVDWKLVLKQFTKFDEFFAAMKGYDIAPLVAAPPLAEYLSATYFGEDGLNEALVRRSSVACSALFRWSSQTMTRVHSALELARVDREIAALLASLPPDAARDNTPEPEPFYWRLKSGDDWADYPVEIHDMFVQAEGEGHKSIRFELYGQQCEVDLVTRTQRTLSTGFASPMRPGGVVLTFMLFRGCGAAALGSL